MHVILDLTFFFIPGDITINGCMIVFEVLPLKCDFVPGDMKCYFIPGDVTIMVTTFGYYATCLRWWICNYQIS